MNKPNNPVRFTVLEVDWKTAEAQLRAIRQRVFIEEQRVPVALEWDGLDNDAIHLLACEIETGYPLGCARILDTGTIGRMAVLKEWRGMGVGRALLDVAIASCHRRGWTTIQLSAQTHAIPFYSRAGFVVCSGEHMDAGIPHRNMCLKLSG